MGWALITDEIGEGRYTIEIDYGAQAKTDAIAALNAYLAQLEVRIAQATVKLAELQEELDAQQAAIQASIDQYIAAVAADPTTSAAQFQQARDYYAKLQMTFNPQQLLLDGLKAAKAQALKQVAYWNTFVPTSTRGAWCVDYTVGATGYVATLDIPGESDLVVLAPACRAWQSNDGVMTAREIQDPNQVYFNAAILPGWQKFKPTYRWGTLTAINYETNTCTVALASALSSAQSLNVNQEATLTNVPIQYMSCNAAAFVVDDRVVVQFLNQDWAQPRVVGFLDNPRPCGGACFWYSIPEYWFDGTNGAGYGAPPNGNLTTIRDNDVTAQYRVDRGPWSTLPLTTSNSTRKGWSTTISTPWGNQTISVAADFDGTFDPFGFPVGGIGPFFTTRPALLHPYVEGETPLLKVIEYRIFLGDVTLFNVATVEFSWFQEPTQSYGQVKNLGGIDLALYPDLNATEFPAVELDYQLFLETGD